MTSDACATNGMRHWIVATAVIGLLFAASLAAAVHFWPRKNYRHGTPEQDSSSPKTANTEKAPQRPPVAVVDPQVLRRLAWDKIARRLAPADASSLAAIEGALEPIDEFFAEHRDGARPFAKSVLSLRGKWKYVKTRRLFGGEAEDHLAFIDERFREHVFDPDDLKATVEASIADYIRTVQGIENKLLVTCRAEIADIDPLVGSAIPSIGSADAFAASYENMLQSVVHDVARGATADVGVFVGSFVAAEITQQLMVRLSQAIATRLGVSAGVLGAGATGSSVSAGVTIGLAIVIDIGIDRLMRLAGADAASKVTAKVEESVDGLHDFILNGDATAVEAYHRIRARSETFPTAEGRAKIAAALRAMEAKGELGLRRMLFDLHQQRAQLREAALRKLVLEGENT
jgi:hypothetical protein